MNGWDASALVAIALPCIAATYETCKVIFKKTNNSLSSDKPLDCEPHRPESPAVSFAPQNTMSKAKHSHLTLVKR